MKSTAIILYTISKWVLVSCYYIVDYKIGYINSQHNLQVVK